MKDNRYILMKERFQTLSNEQLTEIENNIDITLFDEYNYNNGKFCPIGIALGCHNIENPTQEIVKEKISERYTPANMIKGIRGKFYHGTDEERREDLLNLIKEVLNER